jgi:hypothetical protein
MRGRRECRVRAAPAVSCARCTKKCAHEHTGSAEAIRHSLRNGFNAYNALSPETGLSCLRRLKVITLRLDPSVGGSGPHAFAVRVSRARLARQRVHRIPLPTSVTTAKRPSDGGGTARNIRLICVSVKEKYFSDEGLTRFRKIGTSGKSPGKLAATQRGRAGGA